SQKTKAAPPLLRQSRSWRCGWVCRSLIVQAGGTYPDVLSISFVSQCESTACVLYVCMYCLTHPEPVTSPLSPQHHHWSSLHHNDLYRPEALPHLWLPSSISQSFLVSISVFLFLSAYNLSIFLLLIPYSIQFFPLCLVCHRLSPSLSPQAIPAFNLTMLIYAPWHRGTLSCSLWGETVISLGRV
uniref:Uncharacterized protein n=1 Tax=Labrus bergylta TaxID=56723 RepID=A0A3Q3GUB4_9LABR